MIKDFKDLEKLIRLCRKTGIASIKVGGVEIELGTEPTDNKRQNKRFQVEELPGITADMKIPLPTVLSASDKREIQEQGRVTTDLPSDDDLLFYSADSQEPVPQ